MQKGSETDVMKGDLQVGHFHTYHRHGENDCHQANEYQ